jgi:hypothetical protein
LRTTLLILTIGLFAVNGCQKAKNSSDNLSDQDSVRDEDSFHRYDQPIDSDTTTILYRNNFVHEFSDNVKKDSFNIYIKGKTLLGGHVKFEIKNTAGQILLNESFKAIFLLGDGVNPDLSDKEKEDFIKKRINEFFNEIRFFQPAITDQDFNEDFSDKEIWSDIKSDKTAIGFYYLIGEEDGRQIAYSKKLGKIVMYFNCC